MATWGWNKSSEVQQKNHLIISVICEWQQNDQMVNSAISLARRWNAGDRRENFSYTPYKTSRLNNLISYGLFGASESQLIKESQRYESALEAFNAYLRIAGRTNTGLFLNANLIHEPTVKLRDEEKTILGTDFQSLVLEHRNLGDFFRHKYTKFIHEANSCFRKNQVPHIDESK